MKPVPLGVYDEPYTGEFPGFRSIELPDALPVRAFGTITKARDTVAKIADAIVPFP